jgi:hypothetical protein
MWPEGTSSQPITRWPQGTVNSSRHARYPPPVTAPDPPPLPEYAHPGLAGKVVTTTHDGARWRWNGSDWELLDPPGTDQDAIRQHRLVDPLLALATNLARAETPDQEAIAALLDIPGRDRAALLEAAALCEGSSSERLRGASRLLRRAAELE